MEGPRGNSGCPVGLVRPGWERRQRNSVGKGPIAMRKNFVLTLTGADRIGIVESLTKVLLDRGGNVETSRMARLGGEFAVLMLVSLPEEQLADLDGDLAGLVARGYKVTTATTGQIDAESQPGGLLPDRGPRRRPRGDHPPGGALPLPTRNQRRVDGHGHDPRPDQRRPAVHHDRDGSPCRRTSPARTGRPASKPSVTR